MNLRKVMLALLMGLTILAYFGNLTGLELRAEEPRRAVVTMEMAMNSDLVVPQIGGMPYYNKPPMFNWVMLGFFKICGSYSEWVVRLPGLISLLLLAFLSYRVNRKFLGERVAGLSAALLLVSADLLFYGTVNSGEIDLFYALICFMQVSSIFLYRENLWKLFIVSYLLAAIGFLTKGMPSLAFQAMTLLVFFVWNKNWKKLFSVQHVAGIVSLVAVNAIYFSQYAQSADVRSFLIRQFKEASMRTGAETPFTDTLMQFFSFPVHFLVLMLPAALFVVYLFKKPLVIDIMRNEWTRFSVLFILANIWLYWFSGDFKARYYYMFFPFVIGLLVYAREKGRTLYPKLRNRLSKVTAAIVILLLLGVVGGQYFFPYNEQPLILMLMFFIVLLAAFFSVLYFKTDHKWYAIVGLMLLARITFNYSYIPNYQQNNDGMTYRDQCESVLQITGDQAVYLYGDPFFFESDVSLGPATFDKVTLKTAPLLPYQIPYYMSRSNGHILEFKEDLEEDKFYLLTSDRFDKYQMDSLGSIDDHWMQRRFLLVRTHSSPPSMEIE